MSLQDGLFLAINAFLFYFCITPCSAQGVTLCIQESLVAGWALGMMEDAESRVQVSCMQGKL